MRKIGLQPTVPMLVLGISVDVVIAVLLLAAAVVFIDNVIIQFVVTFFITFIALMDIFRGYMQWSSVRPRRHPGDEWSYEDER